MRAHPSTYPGKRHGQTHHFQGGLVITLRQKIDEVLAVDPGRACNLAGRVNALAGDFNLRRYFESKVTGFNIY